MARDLMAAVGKGCPNLPPDVRLLQELLNKVPGLSIDQMMTARLAVDGQVSPFFIAMLNKYQQRHNSMVLEKERVEPGGPTISYLASWDSNPPLTREATMMCPHGAQIVVANTGKANPMVNTLSVGATLIIAGCPMMIGPMPSPCVTAKFLSSPAQNLVDQQAMGLCFGANGAPQGPIIITYPGAMCL